MRLILRRTKAFWILSDREGKGLYVQLHVRNTVHQQTPCLGCSFVNHDMVSSFVEHVCRCETGRSRTDDDDGLTGACFGWSGYNPAHLESFVDNCTFDTYI